MKYIRKIIYVFAMSFMIAMTGCEDEETNFTVPSDPRVEGIVGVSDTVTMGALEVYSVEAARTKAGSTYAWSVTGATAPVTSGTSIEVTFDGGTTVTSASISVTETNASGVSGEPSVITVVVEPDNPSFTANWGSGVAISDGGSDTLFLSFDKEIAAVPALTVLSGGGSFGTVIAQDERDIYSVYTHAGGGNGSVTFSVTGAVATDTFGGLGMLNDGDTLSIISIDNTAPMIAATDGVISSTSSVQPGSPVLLSLKFSEQLAEAIGDGEEVPESLVLETGELKVFDTLTISLTGTGLEESEVDLISEDGITFEGIYTPIQTGTGDIDQAITTTNVTPLTGITDAAGNELAAFPSFTVSVDNIEPSLTSQAAVNGVDDGSIDLTATANEESTIYYLVLASGADAPTALAAFSETLTMGAKTIDFVQNGAYDVYFVAVDVAGNEGQISAAQTVTVP